MSSARTCRVGEGFRTNRKVCTSIVVIIALLLVSTYVTVAWAYTYTAFEQEGPVGTSMQSVAETDDPSVVSVTFAWYNPSGSLVYTDVVTTSYPPQAGWSYPYNFYSPVVVPNVSGTWRLYITFTLSSGATVTHVEYVGIGVGGNDPPEIPTPPPSVVPEVPVLGTFGAVIAMLLAIGLFIRLKRSQR
jgi:hypothetical protein